MSAPGMLRGSLRYASPIVKCDRCQKVTPKLAGVQMGKDFVCRQCYGRGRHREAMQTADARAANERPRLNGKFTTTTPKEKIKWTP